MPKQLILEAQVSLPLDMFDAAEVCAQIKPAWLGLIERLKAAGVEHETRTEILEVRQKTTRRPRKPKLVPVPDTAA